MSLGIAFKGAEGVVLAADSRVTLTALMTVAGQQPFTIPATFDNATKLLRVAGQPFVGAVTYGVGALGANTMQPRTAHSFIPEFEAELAKKALANTPNAGDLGQSQDPQPKIQRLSVESFARELSNFFLRQWRQHQMPEPAQSGNEMVFLVGGYDENEPYGRVFEIFIPTHPDPVERNVNDFGMIWGGQRDFVDRLIVGFDGNLPTAAQSILHLTDPQKRP